MTPPSSSMEPLATPLFLAVLHCPVLWTHQHAKPDGLPPNFRGAGSYIEASG